MHTLCKGLASIREIPDTVIVHNVQYKRSKKSPELEINYSPRKREHVVTVSNTKGTIVSTMYERAHELYDHHNEVSIEEFPRVWHGDLKDKTRTKFVFTKESILEYVHAVQDLNPVYYEEVPSVPELMILTHMAHHVLDEELLLQLDITFTAPFYGGDVISVEKYDIRAEGRLQKGSCELVGTHGGRATCKWIYGKELLNDKD